MRFKSSVNGVPCWINVVFYEPFVPGRLTGDPYDCYPDEGGYGEWEVLDLQGQLDHDLERQLTRDDENRINDELFKFMEGDCDEFTA